MWQDKLQQRQSISIKCLHLIYQRTQKTGAEQHKKHYNLPNQNVTMYKSHKKQINTQYNHSMSPLKVLHSCKYVINAT